MIRVYLTLSYDLRCRSGLVDPQTGTETPLDVLFHTTLNAAVRAASGVKKHRVLVKVLVGGCRHVIQGRGLGVFLIRVQT